MVFNMTNKFEFLYIYLMRYISTVTQIIHYHLFAAVIAFLRFESRVYREYRWILLLSAVLAFIRHLNDNLHLSVFFSHSFMNSEYIFSFTLDCFYSFKRWQLLVCFFFEIQNYCLNKFKIKIFNLYLNHTNTDLAIFGFQIFNTILSPPNRMTRYKHANMHKDRK